MQYIFHSQAGEDQLSVDADLHKYLFKVRRSKIGDILFLRNLIDDNLYRYTVSNIDKKNAWLKLLDHEQKSITNTQSLHIGWCVIDPKNIEKVLPSLNEIGVEKITFIYCDYSQSSFKINIQRLEKILINSSQQCGRSTMMQFDIVKDLKTFLDRNDDVYCIDFTLEKTSCETLKNVKTIVLGCEGGFSAKERKLFQTDKIIGFDTPTILRSETAIISIASKILL